jgi:hypothetical protein
MLKIINILSFGILLFSFTSAAWSQSEGDVLWCLDGDATYRIEQQPMRDYCPSVLAGTLIGNWYGSKEAQLIATMTQKEWSRRAAYTLACSKNPSEWPSAVGLIAACQCHNGRAAEWVMGHPDQVLATMRSWAKCN